MNNFNSLTLLLFLFSLVINSNAQPNDRDYDPTPPFCKPWYIGVYCGCYVYGDEVLENLPGDETRIPPRQIFWNQFNRPEDMSERNCYENQKRTQGNIRKPSYTPYYERDPPPINKINLDQGYKLRAGVYPNPSGDYVNFELNATEEDQVSLQVFDVVGKTVHLSPNAVMNNILRIDVRALGNGTYFYNLTINGKSQRGKIEVLH